MLLGLKKLFRRKDKEIERTELELLRAYKKTFSSPEGEAVFVHLLKRNYFVTSTIGSGDPSPQLMAYREGCRCAVLGVIEMLQLTEEEISERLTKESEHDG